MKNKKSTEAQTVVEYLRKNNVNVRKLSAELGIPMQRIYGWTTRGNLPKHEDVVAIKKHFGLDEKPQKEMDKYIITVLVDRVAQLVADGIPGSSKVVEAQKIYNEAKNLSRLDSDSSS